MLRLRKRIRIKLAAGLLLIGVLLVFLNLYLHFTAPPAPPCSPLPQERLGTTVSLKKGIALIVRDDGELWIWNAGKEGAIYQNVMAEKLDDHVIAAGQIHCSVREWSPEGDIGEEKSFIGVLYEDSRFAVWEMDSSDNLLSDRAQIICSDVARFQALEARFDLLKTDGTVWRLTFNESYQRYDATGRKRMFIKWETALTQDKAWKAWRGPVTEFHVGLTDQPQSYMITKDGELWGKGENGLGQLGVGKTGKPIPLGELGFTDWTKITDNIAEVFTMVDRDNYTLRTFALKTDSSLWGWGFVLPDTERQRFQISMRPVRIMENVRAASPGWSHDLILRTDGTLLARGGNYSKELGIDNEEIKWSTETIEVMKGVRSICARYRSSYAIKDDGSLWSWGENGCGELGHGTIGDPELPVKIMDHVESVTARDHCAAAVQEDGSVWFWGKIGTEIIDHEQIVYTVAAPICIMEGNAGR